MDPALRMKLVNELKNSDTEMLLANLVKGEGARNKFLEEMHGRMRLEQLKALQRMIKLDEDYAGMKIGPHKLMEYFYFHWMPKKSLGLPYRFVENCLRKLILILKNLI